MLRRKGEFEINGFWIFLILVLFVLPLVRVLKNDDGEKSKNPESGKVRTKVVSGKGEVLDINRNSAIAPINTRVKIPLKEKAVIVKKKFIDGEEEVIKISSKYAITIFDSLGAWEINMYDVDGLLVEWIKITVY